MALNRGRPKTSFDLRAVSLLAKRDATDQEMADHFHVSRATISRAKKTGEFLDALRRGRVGVDWIALRRNKPNKRVIETKASTLWNLTPQARARAYEQYLAARDSSPAEWEFGFVQWWRAWDQSGKYYLYDQYELRLRARCNRWTARNIEVVPKLKTTEAQISLTGTWLEQCVKSKPDLPQVVAPKHAVRSNSTADDLDRAGREYRQQKRNACARGVKWRFTFSSWRKVWDESGHYGERGPHVGQYSMQRVLDGDTYAPKSVEIRVNADNMRTMSDKLRYRRGPRITTRGADPRALMTRAPLASVALDELFDSAAYSEVQGI